MENLEDFINCKDPLSKAAAQFLISYKEEDDRVDYKQSLTLDSEKEWLSLTKDISAFANTKGGYLVFGIEDKNKEVVGLFKAVSDLLKDSNNLQLKINRHLEPELTLIRSKEFRIENKKIVIVYIPQSYNMTHMIKKDGIFDRQSGQPKIVLKQGTFYVRRSGGNHLGDSRDLDDLIERRIDQFRDSLLDKVARVVKAPAKSNVFIASKDPEDPTNERFIIEDSPESIPIKGMSFTVSPESGEEEIAAWTVLSSSNSNVKPPPEVIWKWYLQKDSLEIRQTHKLSIFQFSLWSGAPVFYWIQGIENSIIRKKLLETIRLRPTGIDVEPALIVACFLGKATYNEVIKSLGSYVEKLAPRMRKFPITTPMNAFNRIKPLPKQKLSILKREKLKEVNALAQESVEKQKDLGAMKRQVARDIDRFLFAQEDNYKRTSS